MCVQELCFAMRSMLIGLGTKRSLAALEAQALLSFKGAEHITPENFIFYLRIRMGGVPKFEKFL